MCLVSVIVPVYNNEQYIKESLDSVINLTYKNIEIIVIDDGSKDESISIVKKYCKLDKRIVFFQNEKNIGTAKTIKRGIRESKGKYIFFNAADDISLQNRIERCLSIFHNNKNIGLIASTAIIINSKSQETGKMTEINEKVQNSNISIEQFKRNYCLGATMAIVNDKNILLKEGMLEYTDDYETSLEYLLNGYDIYLLREPLVKYRMHENNQSNSRGKLSEKVKLTLEKYKDKDIYNNLVGRGYSQNEIYVTLGILNLFKENTDNTIHYLNLVNLDLNNTNINFEKNFYLGVVNYRLKNFVESFKKFHFAYSIDSCNPAVLNNLGVLEYYNNQNKVESIKKIKRALKIYPEYIDAKKNIEYLTNSTPDFLKITERIIDIQIYARYQYNI